MSLANSLPIVPPFWGLIESEYRSVSSTTFPSGLDSAETETDVLSRSAGAGEFKRTVVKPIAGTSARTSSFGDVPGFSSAGKNWHGSFCPCDSASATTSISAASRRWKPVVLNSLTSFAPEPLTADFVDIASAEF